MMIQQIGSALKNSQSTQNQSIGKAKNEFTIPLQDEAVGEITFNSLGEKMKFGCSVEGSMFAEYFTKEQIERWQNSTDTVDATHRAFLNFIAFEPSNESGTFSMHFYDFCYLLEQGQIVNPKNVGFTEEIIKNNNWDFSVMLTEAFGVRDEASNAQQLNIMRTVMDLGMVSKDGRLMSPQELQELLAKKKYQEQQLLMEKAFEKKHLLQQQIQSNK